MLGLRCVVANRGYSLAAAWGLLLSQSMSRASGLQGLWRVGSVIVPHLLSCYVAHVILVPPPGIEPVSPALGLDHWTTREVPKFPTFLKSLREDIHSPVCPVPTIPGIYIHPAYSLLPTQPLQTLSFCPLIYAHHVLAKESKSTKSITECTGSMRFSVFLHLPPWTLIPWTDACAVVANHVLSPWLTVSLPPELNANLTSEGQLMVMVSFRMVPGSLPPLLKPSEAHSESHCRLAKLFLFHYGLSQNIEYSFRCYAVGSCCLSILHVIVCIC